jgi:hypothetical protein
VPGIGDSKGNGINVIDPTELTLAEQIQTLQNETIARATTTSYDDGTYQALRRALMENDEVKGLVPPFVRTSRDLSQFWAYISTIKGYVDRRKHIWDGFRPLFDHVEGRQSTLAAKQLTDALESLSLDEVNRVWTRGLERLSTDPSGAITTARTLLESTCKHILDAESVKYDDAADLPKLYRLTAQTLQLSPEPNSEQAFRQVLGGCQTVVEGVAMIRNKLGDSHGKGANAPNADERHARLALNLAAAAATFLVETWRDS